MGEQERIQRCLLEYGDKSTAVRARVVTDAAPAEVGKGLLHDIAKQAMAAQLRRASSAVPTSAPLTDFERQYQTAESDALAAEAQILHELQAREQELLQHAMAVQDRAWRQTDVANLESMAAAAAVYSRTSEIIRSQSCPDEAAALGFMAEKRRLEREVNRLEAVLAAQTLEVQHLEATKAALAADEAVTNAAQASASAKRQELQAHETAVAAQETACNQTSSDLTTLRGLISQHTSLKLQESTFKASCKDQLVLLQTRVESLPQEPQHERHAQLEAKMRVVSAKRAQLQQEVAREVHGVLSALRLLDDVPCKSELLQYEKRFLELYDEVALTLEDTRKYFGVYNALEETHEYLEKEVALIDSINANFEIALSSKAATDVFFSQLQAVIANVQANVAKQQSLCEAKQLHVDTLDSKYQLLLEKQQSYVAAIRDFQRECEKNEKLQDRLDRALA